MLLKTANAAYSFNTQTLELEAVRLIDNEVELRYEDDKIEVSQSPVAIYVLDKTAGTSSVILPPGGGRIAGAAYVPNTGLIILDGDGRVSITKR